MYNILGVVGGASVESARNDDDFSDRLSHRYTTGLLIVAALVVSTKQYVGDPITCWTPAHFTGNHDEYTNSYCWVKNTYYTPFEDYIPQEEETHLRDMIPYYQWVPIILLVSALMFYLPCMFWRTLNSKSGIDVNNIVEAAETFQDTDKSDTKNETLRSMTRQMDRYLRSAQDTEQVECTLSIKNAFTSTCCSCCGRRHGNFLVSLYLVTKILFILNSVGQLFLMNIFLGMDYHLYGFDMLSSLSRGEDWTRTARFPRVTMCDLKIRRLGNIQRYTVQCVLPINLFNEAIFLFIWFWMVYVAFMSCFTLLSWTMKSAFVNDRLRYIRKHLELQQKIKKDEHDFKPDVDGFTKGTDEDCDNFVMEYLQQDGVFMMRLAGANTNAITATEFICSIWDHWLNGILPETGKEKAAKVKAEKEKQEEIEKDMKKKQLYDDIARHDEELIRLMGSGSQGM